jgi:chemotaxis receptor (MCP) glutamine deamidase CheD
MIENNFQIRKIEKEAERIMVDMEDYEIIKPGMIGETTALGPCFGIIIYDTESKYAIVGHFTSPSQTKDYFNSMFTEAKQLFKNLEKVKVYVGGGSPVPDDSLNFKDDKENRDFVKNKLKESGFQIMKVNYQNSMDSTILRIDTRNGAVDYDTDSHWKNEEI